MPNLNSCLLSSLLTMAPEEEEEDYSLQEQFDAAVKVMWSLPEEGPFQPSDDMMLMFYSYYKQATLGPCTEPRPTGFWDTRGKAKWDAWSALGNMTREEAMKNYVDDIQLILETIPISSEVTDLVQKLGNFFTEAEIDLDAEEHEGNRRPFTRPFAQHPAEQALHPSIQGFGDLWDDIQNLPEIEKDEGVAEQESDCDVSAGRYKEEEEAEEQGWASELLTPEYRSGRSDDRGSDHGSVEPSVSSLTFGTHSSLNSEVEEEELAYSKDSPTPRKLSKHLSGLRDRRVRAADSDNEEFCDSMEHLAIDEGLPKHELRAGSMRESDSWFFEVDQSDVGDGTRTVDFKSAVSRRETVSSGPDCGSQSGLSIKSALCGCGSQSDLSVSRSGGNVNEQICSALLRLQRDMDQVLLKLHSLERLQTPQPPSPLQEPHPLTAALQFFRGSWWPSQSPVSVFFTVMWPVCVHWLVLFYLQRRRRRITA